MTAPTIIIRDAIKAVLAADPDITALVANRIHDRVPSPVKAWPFIAFGPMRFTRTEAGSDGPVLMTVHRIYTASTEYERDQAWALADFIERALDGINPALEGDFASCMEWRATLAGDIIEANQPKQVFVDISGAVMRVV